MKALVQKFFGSGNRRGILSMITAMLLFTTNDVFVKLSTEHATSGHIMLMRSGGAVLIIFIILLIKGETRQLKLSLDRNVLLRALSDLIATLTFVYAIFHMPLPNLSAIVLGSPVVLTACGALVLRESVGWRRWTAVCFGLAGVLLIVQPAGESFNVWSLLAIVCLFGVVGRDLFTRIVGISVPATVSIFSACLVMTLSALVMLASEGWPPLAPRELIYLSLSAIFMTGGYVMSIDAMRHGELAVVGPFRYTGLLAALFYGYTIWGDIPNDMAKIGIAVVVGSGLYILHREAVRTRAAKR